MKKLTLEDIGKLAGVSRATVSRVINGYPHIRPDVRERVEKVIAQTGFRPNAIARSLVSNRTNIIGLVVPILVKEVFDDPYFPTLIQGVIRAGAQHDQIVSLYLQDSIHNEEYLAESIIRAGLLDGIILALGEYNLSQLIAGSSIPIVTVGRPEKPIGITYVDIDNQRGGYLATRHLLELGHRRIGMIAARFHVAGQGRYRGYLQAMSEYGLSINPDWIAESDFSVASAYVAARQVLAHHPTAIFVSSDRMALAAMEVLQAENLRVPEDVALVGFDDLLPALQADPPLTTVRQPIGDMGAISVELLLDMIDNPGSIPEPVIVPAELVIRESCGYKQNDFRSESR